MKRLKELDSLRGFAAMSVLFLHYTLYYGTEFGWVAGRPIFTFSLVRTGVSIFFIISGFVIFHSLQRAQTMREFALARFARLYPAYLLCLGLTSMVVFVGGFNFRHLSGIDCLINLTMMAHAFGRVTFDGSYWTLAREILFYGLASAMAFTAGKDKIVVCSAIWMVFNIVVNVFVADKDHFVVTGWRSEIELLTNAQFGYLFCCGMMLYRMSVGDRSMFVIGTFFLAIASAGFSEWADRNSYGFKEVGVAIIDVCVVSSIVVFKPSFMRYSLFIWLGTISYSLYLIHETVGFAIIWHLQKHGVNANLAIVVAVFTAIAIAALIQKFVEVPAQRAIQRWSYPRSEAHTENLPANYDLKLP